MSYDPAQAVAIVGVGAILPDAPDAASFWRNLTEGSYSISEVDPARWDPDLHYDPDPKAQDKTYSKIGGWVGDWEWDPLGWRLPIPPKVSDAMDDGQKWGIACTRMALADYGWPARELDTERTAVVIGNAMAGEKHYLTALRLTYPELARELAKAPSYAALSGDTRAAITDEFHHNLDEWLPPVTEDTMPGELGNVLAGRIANLFNLRGPNFVTDAACASAMAAIDASIEGLVEGDFDAVITGGIDRNMGASSYIKFCAIGALSATGTRPYADGADGFVMGEGAALFVLKRLADAERDGDRVYAVIRGIAGASDGKGKGITAPNPVGQKLAVERAWLKAGLSPESCTMIEGHGTSTRVGDLAEVESLGAAFAGAGLAPESVALGSVKSNIGHLKGAAGAAGILKTALALHHRAIPASLHFDRPNPNIDWPSTPFKVNSELREWETLNGDPRVAGVSAFGFGGTNFHAVLEEHLPGRFNGRSQIAVPESAVEGRAEPGASSGVGAEPKAPLRGAIVAGASDERELVGKLEAIRAAAAAGRAPEPSAPNEADLRAPERIAIDYDDASELAAKAEAALKALESGNNEAWKLLRGRGVFRGSGPAGKVAFLYTGQGSQYANMLGGLWRTEPLVSEVFDEADRVMRPLLDGRALTDIIFADPNDAEAMSRAEEALRPTEVTQPAVLAVDIALTRLLAAYGVEPDFVMGHSLGEYAALVAAGSLSLEAALEAVSARGREMAGLRPPDPGAMAAVFAPVEEIEEILASIDGYAVIANVNSTQQVVIGGETAAVGRAVALLQEREHQAIPLPVSHAFHTKIVAGAIEPLRATLRRLDLKPPQIPLVANVNGDFYPTGPDAAGGMIELLGRQVASPVLFLKGLHTLFDAGARVFVETGPKRALQVFAADVLDEEETVSLSTNHPKLGDVVSFNHALCGLYASGLGTPAPATSPGDDSSRELRQRFAEFLERGRELLGELPASPAPDHEPVVITGAGLGLPGAEPLFDEHSVARILHGEQLIDVIPSRIRHEIVDRHITRLRKGDDGSANFVAIDDVADVIKLAARGGELDLVEEFGVDAERVAALGRDTQLAIAAGIDALRDAGIPLVREYKTTSTGSRLPQKWMLPAALRDETGVIFASAFPGLEEMVGEMDRFWAHRSRREQLAGLEELRERLAQSDSVSIAEVERRIHDLKLELAEQPYQFDRRFLFRVLSMGHSQFAELIGARGPNTQINSACASTTQAVTLAEDWIRAGRCRRVVVLAADDATSDTLLPWLGAGFLASGAAATDEVVEEAALPFDRRRHGMLIGMGAAALVVESAGSARERGLTPICEVLGTVTANSAFHGTRLDVDHIGQVMEDVVAQAEARGVRRDEIAPETVFVSHETYTPARGGSSAAEIFALRRVFGDAAADRIVIANTKGFTGHPMGVGIEDVVAVKSLETGLVPPVPNFRDVDPELGELNLSKGGIYPVRYALRLAAGFGSQISMMLLRWTPVRDGRRRNPEELGHAYRVADEPAWSAWLRRISGEDAPELEVVQHRLRVVDRGVVPVAERSVQVEPAEPVSAEPVVAAPEPPVQALAADDVEARVLELVAEQTGYPSDMLDLDLDLEADLGIDTVKQAEVFASIREAYGIARDDSLKLRDYPTLNSVVGFVRERSTRPSQPAPEPATEAPPATDDVEARVLELVAEQTGYPSDMLDLDLDLEADLGIDTVKQAEVFASIREAYGIARDDSLKLRDYPTLNSVVGFVRERSTRPSQPAPEPATEAPPAPAGVGEAGDGGFPRRVPAPIVRPPLDRCVETGVMLGAGSRIVLMPDSDGVAEALASRLGKLGVEILRIDGAPDAEELERTLAEWTAAGPVQGVYWLAALDDEGPLSALDPAGWHEGLRVRVKLLAATMRALAEHVAGEGTFLVSATRLGGRLGYDAPGATSVMGGAVSGFTKALARERENVLAKVVDFAPSQETAALADLILEETLRDPGALEIGYADDVRWTVGLVERPATTDPARALTRDSVFVVTGAAGSIVSAITADLAAASGGTFHLLDLVPAPDASDPDIERFTADRDRLKEELADRIKESGERVTPKLVERELTRIERARAALDAIQAIERTGGSAHWHQADLTDAGQVAEALRGIERVDVLLHCAGLEISHFLPDKPQREYDLVFDVKADGWFNLLHALREVPIGSAVVFSSIAGPAGNAGQTDYSAANDLMCKSVSRMRRDGDTRAVAIDWTAWAGLGMASRGSIPKMMALAGIDMLPPEVGVPVVRRELTASGPGGEVLVAGSLGLLDRERHPTGGFDPDSVPKLMAAEPGPMTGRVVAFTVGGGVIIETALDPSRQAFLHDHRIDGTPVLPGVMGLEGFAEAASALLPGWHVAALENVELLAPFKFYRDEPRTLELEALLRDAGDGGLEADCRLIGRRTLPGQPEQTTIHFTARARLARELPEAPRETPPADRGDGVGHESVYRIYFHGPAYQVLDRVWRTNGVVVGRLAGDLPPDHEPLSRPMQMAPRLIELCFQTAGVWELGTGGRMALPTHVDRVTHFHAGDESGPLFAVVRPTEDGIDAEVVGDDGRVHIRLEGYRTIELPGGLDAEALAPITTAMA